jgi:hypothetical protein
VTIEDAGPELGLDERAVKAAVAAGWIATVAFGDQRAEQERWVRKSAYAVRRRRLRERMTPR